MATIKNLKIKTSTCKRLVKELHSYEKEVEREAAKPADMKEKGADPYDLKQQENVLGESRMMIPDCHKRLEAALADLKSTLTNLEETDEKEGPEIEEAKKNSRRRGEAVSHRSWMLDLGAIVERFVCTQL